MYFDILKLFERYPSLEVCRPQIATAVNMICQMYYDGGKLLICGNGGSCADADHICGEMMKGFLLPRQMPQIKADRFFDVLGTDAGEFICQLQESIPTISLPSQAAVLSAFANDVNPDLVYAQLVYGYAREGDVFLGISTSGNSENVVAAAKVAKVMGLKTIAMTGECESRLSEICDCTIRVPQKSTFKIQELHLPIYHAICAEVEMTIFS